MILHYGVLDMFIQVYYLVKCIIHVSLQNGLMVSYPTGHNYGDL